MFTLKIFLYPTSLCPHWKHPFYLLSISTPHPPCSNSVKYWFRGKLVKTDLERQDPLLTYLTSPYWVQLYDNHLFYPIVQQWEEDHAYLSSQKPEKWLYFCGCMNKNKRRHIYTNSKWYQQWYIYFKHKIWPSLFH